MATFNVSRARLVVTTLQDLLDNTSNVDIESLLQIDQLCNCECCELIICCLMLSLRVYRIN